MKTHFSLFVRRLKRHAKKFWLVWLLLAIGVYGFEQRFQFEWNMTQSLPQKLFLVDKKDKELKRGSFVMFYAPESAVGRAKLPFIKEVVCLPGEEVREQERAFSCGYEDFAVAKTHSLKGEPLEASPSQTLGAGEWFVRGTHPDSFDSRYAAFGPLKADQIIGKAYPIF